MKRFRFATSHLIMIGMILFGVLAISTRVFPDSPLLMLIIFLVCVVVVLILCYQKSVYEISELEQIELLNSQTENKLITMLDQMPVGVIQFDPETNKIEWFNPFAELIFTKEDGEFDHEFIGEVIQNRKEGSADQTMEVGENKYSVYLDLINGIFYFFNLVRENEDQKQISDLQAVIGVISIDNYDDIIETLADADVSQINGFIAGFISEFAQNREIFYRRVSMDRFYFFTDYSILNQLIEDKFDVLEQFRKEAQERQLPLTLSMGISYGIANHDQIGQVALKNLNIALVRGGDQAVIRENGEHKKLLYFGGGTVSTIKRSRTRTRAMMTAFSDKIKTADCVFVVGHKNLDMDALGASVGMQTFARNIIDEAYVVYDEHSMSHDVKRAIQRLKDDGKTQLLTVEEALEKVTENSLLVMVDHSKLQLTLSRDLYSKFTEVIVIDHHRREEDFPDNAVLSFIESGASSASELVTELLQFQNGKIRLSKIQASIVMAGIMLDTKNFSARVTSRTFDVASYLRTLGSDNVEIQSISALDFDEYRKINELILHGEKVFPNLIIATGEDDISYTNVIASKAADTMLNMAGIEATFVITKNSSGQVCISARSHDKINVQRIMEEMGGGGHFNLAACQLQDISIKEARQQLIEKIEEEFKEEEGS
ncbi:DHH family phosphoesterase [Streptococcus macacae]|uniref:Cyclic-di-AMP phosphodiesterase n=1 Tax=Streptococcus macacae NCTC 11558 TaxID=764298 RepID=G5JX35_9STRE|nr:DHH family phosphoesterase [Streptococcus macacae]EHJ53143.1 DHHA1 domain protein [Streptococcus macacae NCTC 11558]SUN79743.1 Phosphoesterase, DHH family protein [Streptococcus macacae NCTC 11558]